MELKQLQRFLAVANDGTLAAAARTLGLTQQALSASLASLEKELDARLFDRAPGGITRLTGAGEALLPHARSQLAGDRRARDAVRALRDAETGTVTIGIGETFAGDIIADAVTQLHRLQPEVRVNLIEGYSEKLLERLYSGEFDFVAAGLSGETLPDGFASERIYSADDVIAARRDHPLAGRRAQLEELAGFTWLIPYSRPSDRAVIVDAFLAADLDPPRRFIGTDAYRIGMKLLAANDFLLMTPAALVTNRLATTHYGITTLDVSRPTVRRNASLVASAERPMTPVAQALHDAIRKAALGFSAPQQKTG
ncbi:MAG: LysR family transcriptional regulator [Pseudomonadota bacterium]